MTQLKLFSLCVASSAAGVFLDAGRSQNQNLPAALEKTPVDPIS